MRIALLGSGMRPLPPTTPSPVDKHVWGLAQGLRRIGHEVKIVNEVFGTRSADEYRFGVWASLQVKKGKFDVAHVHTPGVALALGVLGPRNFVYTTHTPHWTPREKLGENVGFVLEKQAVRRAKRTIAISPSVSGALQDFGVDSVVVPDGVDVDAYTPATHARRGDHIVGIGQIAPHKRWHLAAEAIRGLNARLVLVGPVTDAQYAARVEEAAPGQVTLLGTVSEEDLVATLSESDVLVHPSVSEPFPRAIVEGMACGLPVVASDIVGDLVRREDNGFRVPVDRPDEERVTLLRRHLELLLADGRLRRMMGERSRERAVAEYAWDRIAERVARVYEEAITQ